MYTTTLVALVLLAVLGLSVQTTAVTPPFSAEKHSIEETLARTEMLTFGGVVLCCVVFMLYLLWRRKANDASTIDDHQPRPKKGNLLTLLVSLALLIGLSAPRIAIGQGTTSPSPPVADTCGYLQHTVPKKGTDGVTLIGVARKYYRKGNLYLKIAEANEIEAPYTLKRGRVLKIPLLSCLIPPPKKEKEMVKRNVEAVSAVPFRTDPGTQVATTENAVVPLRTSTEPPKAPALATSQWSPNTLTLTTGSNSVGQKNTSQSNRQTTQPSPHAEEERPPDRPVPAGVWVAWFGIVVLAVGFGRVMRKETEPHRKALFLRRVMVKTYYEDLAGLHADATFGQRAEQYVLRPLVNRSD